MKQYCLILLLAFACATLFPALAQGNDSAWITAQQSDTIRQGMEKQESVIEIKVFENRIFVENPQKEMILEIFNIMGVKVYSRRIPPGTGEYPINLPRGYYILKIGKTTKKIAIR